MTFQWSSFVDFAKTLYDTSEDDEARVRTVISRAYYGAFGHARLKQGLFVNERKDVHAKVIGAYKDSSDPHERQIGIWLDSLRKRRIKADYSNEAAVGGGNRALREARRILEKLT